MFNKVCIIGCGLIGSSLARAIKKQNLSKIIVSSNRSDLINKKVIELKIVDDSSSDTKKMAEGSDLIIIATPLSSYENVILKIKNSLKKVNNKVLICEPSTSASVIIMILSYLKFSILKSFEPVPIAFIKVTISLDDIIFERTFVWLF